MAGLAEHHWKDLRPSAAGRYRLDASARYDRQEAGRDLRRPRRHLKPTLRIRSR